MATFEFTPNSVAVDLFKVNAKAVTGDSMTELLRNEVFGKAIYDKHCIAQDPMPGYPVKGRSGVVSFILNPEERNFTKFKYVPVGTLAVLSV